MAFESIIRARIVTLVHSDAKRNGSVPTEPAFKQLEQLRLPLG